MAICSNRGHCHEPCRPAMSLSQVTIRANLFASVWSAWRRLRLRQTRPRSVLAPCQCRRCVAPPKIKKSPAMAQMSAPLTFWPLNLFLVSISTFSLFSLLYFSTHTGLFVCLHTRSRWNTIPRSVRAVLPGIDSNTANLDCSQVRHQRRYVVRSRLCAKPLAGYPGRPSLPEMIITARKSAYNLIPTDWRH